MTRQEAERAGRQWAGRCNMHCWYLCQHTDGHWFYASPARLEAALSVTVKAYRYQWDGRKFAKGEI